MSDIDDFAGQLVEEAKRFLEKGAESSDLIAKAAYLHAALMLAFSGLEAHVNAIADEFSSRAELTVHERAFLLEKDIRLSDGEFVVRNSLKMSRLEDRIEFLHRKFSGKAIDRTQVWWSAMSNAVDLRNQLTHPKGIPQITENAIKSAIQSIIEALDAIYQALYRRKLPMASRGLMSRLVF